MNSALEDRPFLGKRRTSRPEIRREASTPRPPTNLSVATAVTARVNDHDYHSLFAALNTAAEILHRNRTPDPVFVAAFDTLKQSRAMLEKAIAGPAAAAAGSNELVAA